MRSSIKHSLAQPLQKCSQLCIHNSIHTLSLESYDSSCLHTPIDSTHSSSKGRQRIAAEQSSVRWWIFSRGYTPPENDSVPGNLALPCNTRNPSCKAFEFWIVVIIAGVISMGDSGHIWYFYTIFCLKSQCRKATLKHSWFGCFL